MDTLTPAERDYIQQHFDPYANEVVINRDTIGWDTIEEVEVAEAARSTGPAGWLVKYLFMGGSRYHVGVYFGREEAVLTNMTLNCARYIVQMIAFYAPKRVLYNGPEDICPLDIF